jgi:hypothetical protein
LGRKAGWWQSCEMLDHILERLTALTPWVAVAGVFLLLLQRVIEEGIYRGTLKIERLRLGMETQNLDDVAIALFEEGRARGLHRQRQREAHDVAEGLVEAINAPPTAAPPPAVIDVAVSGR